MRTIDFEKWERREPYRWFGEVSNPFYAVTFRQDVTEFFRWCKAREKPVYLSMVYQVMRALNGVKAFRYGYDAGRFVLYDHRDPSFTVLPSGAAHFRIVTVPWQEDEEAFLGAARQKIETQQAFIEPQSEGNHLAFLSCLPWLDLTGLTNERAFDPHDAIPRIAWGKFVREGDRVMAGFCVEVHHGFIDGEHIGAFHEALTRQIQALGN